jgi:SLT domain-containing protein
MGARTRWLVPHYAAYATDGTLRVQRIATVNERGGSYLMTQAGRLREDGGAGHRAGKRAGPGRQTANEQEANMSTSAATPTIVLNHGRLQSKARAITAFKEFPERPNFTLVDGWEKLADYALHRALNPTPSVEEL